MTLEAPAASAMATSRGWRTPPSAQTCLPRLRASAAHSRTAENCGRPTPVIMRVVHIAPGPTPTLMMSAPASIRSRTPSAATTLPATIGTCGSRPRTAWTAAIIDSWWPCAVSTTRMSAPASSSCLGLAGHVAVDADGGGDAQLAVGVDGRGVEGRAQGALAGQDAGEPAVLVHGGRERRLAPSSVSKASRGSMSASRSSRSRDMTSDSWVKRSDARAVGLGDDADRPPSASTTTRAPWARLGSSASASATVLVGARTIGVSSTWCRALDPARSPR